MISFVDELKASYHISRSKKATSFAKLLFISYFTIRSHIGDAPKNKRPNSSACLLTDHLLQRKHPFRIDRRLSYDVTAH